MSSTTEQTETPQSSECAPEELVRGATENRYVHWIRFLSSLASFAVIGTLATQGLRENASEIDGWTAGGAFLGASSGFLLAMFSAVGGQEQERPSPERFPKFHAFYQSCTKLRWYYRLISQKEEK